jgi:hypothetical protein
MVKVAECLKMALRLPDLQRPGSGGLLVFSKPHESNFPEDWFAIEPGALNLAVDFARVKLEQFELTLLPIVERLVPRSEARDIVRILVRGH